MLMLKKLGLELSNLHPWGTPKSTGRGVRVQGFTAIELTGVLAVLAILAATVIPNVIRRIDFATWQRETSDLKVMANGLVRTILLDKAVYNQAGLPAAAAKYLDLSLSQVTTNSRGFSRVFLVDPSLNINGVSASGLPYPQGNSGSTNRPGNPRMMIVSTLARALPTALSSINAANFANIWTTPDGVVPSALV